MNFINKLNNKVKTIYQNIINRLNHRKLQRKQYLYAKTERSKPTKRTDIINFLLSLKQEDTIYLEIGVRNRKSNFDMVDSKFKYSVDPDVDIPNKNHFKLTSDVFFEQLDLGEILKDKIRFDIIFIDGLHLAEQVEKDIKNSLKFIKSNGFIVLHDCNPPSEWHARETYSYYSSPAKEIWNGTVWKAFLKKRFDKSIKSCCIDTDWGIGILSKKAPIGDAIPKNNHFFEFESFKKNKKTNLNLMSFEEFKELII
tara:strand:+ start:420 stop:1181 length:762 start_codon:yes stop_codon:yes gene_type:complete